MFEAPRMIRGRLALFLSSISLIVIPSLAEIQTGLAAGTMATMVGPLGLLVDLGIQNIPGISLPMARLIYNWISFMLVVWIAFVSDERTATMFCITATGISALTAWFGWFTTPSPNGQWGLIVLCALLSVTMYFTEKKRLNFGTSGGGDPMINVVVFFLLLQATVGLINGAGIFQPGSTIATPSECVDGNYESCAINGNLQLQNLRTNTGTNGFLDGAFNVLTTVTTLGWALIVLVIQIAVSIVVFAYVLYTIYPWVASSPQALALLGLFQLMIWFIYLFTILRYVWKTMPGDGRI